MRERAPYEHKARSQELGPQSEHRTPKRGTPKRGDQQQQSHNKKKKKRHAKKSCNQAISAKVVNVGSGEIKESRHMNQGSKR